jgi:diacylglycerol kinase (ATP)
LNNSIHLIYNPTAGKGQAGLNMPKVEALLAQHGLEYELNLTMGPGHARELARCAVDEGRGLVVAAGGDGTVNEVINGLLQAGVNGRPRPALGVLPVGRGNDFAYGMNIPQTLPQAVQVLAQGNRRLIDVGRVTGGDYPEGRYFGNGVGLGFDTVVGFEAAKIKWLRGAASYLVGLVRTIFLYARGPLYEIVLDDGEPFQQQFLLVSIMNGRRMGGAFYMAPDGNPGDGSFDLCLGGYVPQIQMLPLAAKFLNGSQKEHPQVKMARAIKISVRAIEGTIPAHADGETICTAGQALTVELFPNALEIISQNHYSP